MLQRLLACHFTFRDVESSALGFVRGGAPSVEWSYTVPTRHSEASTKKVKPTAVIPSFAKHTESNFTTPLHSTTWRRSKPENKAQVLVGSYLSYRDTVLVWYVLS